MVSSMVAVLKAGGTYVPLDGEYPAERLRYMVKDSGVRVLVLTGREGGVKQEGTQGVEVVEYGKAVEAVAAEEEGGRLWSSNPGSKRDRRQAAYVMEGSGSP